jgi:Fic family protein
MQPPFSITSKTLDWISKIERLIGRIEGLDHPKPQPHLRKFNRIRTVQGSLAIEGNTLGLDQVTALLEGKRVIGRSQEIKEILNAIQVYDQIETFQPRSPKDLLKAHRLLMNGLVVDAGKWRKNHVGIVKGSQVAHIAPPAERVPYLMDDLFCFLKNEKTHPLIRSCVFHYELEFIHPFQDGNGRIGRFWHSLLLYHYHPAFEFIPVESIIQTHQQSYYDALEKSDKAGNSTPFVEFSLEMIYLALEDFLENFLPSPHTANDRLDQARKHFVKKEFSRKDYRSLFKTISTATASRDLKQGVDGKILTKSGDKALTNYVFL